MPLALPIGSDFCFLGSNFSPKPRYFRLLVAALALGVPSFVAQARESAPLATPFEVSESPAGNYLAALIAGSERDTLAAATYFRETLRAWPDNTELLERAFIASLANGNMADSFLLAERLIRYEPNNGLAHLALGVRDFKSKNYRAARAQFANSGSNHQRDLTATLLTAWSYMGSNQPAKARETILRLRDESLAVFRDYHGALIEDLAGRGDLARPRFESVYASDRNTLRIVDAYARFLSRQGMMDQARAVYEEYDRTSARNPVIIQQLAALVEKKPLAPLVANADEGAAEVLFGLGSIGGAQGDEFAAMVYLRLALYLEPDNAWALFSLAETYEHLKQYEPAIDVYEMVSKQSPLRTSAETHVGLLLEMAGRSDEATKHLTAVVAENPNDSEAFAALGNLQRSRKDYAAAAASYAKAIETFHGPEKSEWPLFYFRGMSLERSKQWPPAEADFRKALALSPDQPLVLNYLGYSWVDKGVNLEEAFKMLHRAVELRPQDGFIVDSLGWAYYKLGRYEDALRELERAIELRPSDPVINDHLGDVYWRLGRKLEAKFQWNHARDLKPDPEDLPAILKKIEGGLPDDPKPATAEATPVGSPSIPPKPAESSPSLTAPDGGAPIRMAPAPSAPNQTTPAPSSPQPLPQTPSGG